MQRSRRFRLTVRRRYCSAKRRDNGTGVYEAFGLNSRQCGRRGKARKGRVIMPNFQFDRKFGNVHIATHKFRVRNNLRTFGIPLQLTKGSEVKVSGVKLPRYYVVGIFCASRPMTMRLTKADDLKALPAGLDQLRAIIAEFMGEMDG